MTITSKDLIEIHSTSLVIEGTTEEQALYLYDLGFNIIPFYYGAKTPALDWDILQTSSLPRYAVENECKGQNIGVIAGITSRNLFVVDCDDEKVFYEWLGKLSELNLAKWFYLTSRGGHFWFLSEDGVVENKKKMNLEIWGEKHCLLIPPSVNKDTSVVYAWQNREGNLPPSLSANEITKVFGDDIKIRRHLINGIPPTAYKVLIERDINKYQSSSEAEIAAVFSLVSCGFDDDKIIELFNLHKPSHYMSKTKPEEWLKSHMIKPARELRPIKPFQAIIDQLVNFAHIYPWNNRTGNTDKIVFLALCERARREGIDCFRATRRELSDMTNISDKTIPKACKRLLNYGFITRVQDVKDNHYRTNYFSLIKDILNVPINLNNCKFNGEIMMQFINHDIWQPKGLGKSSLNVYLTLLNNPEGKSVKELSLINNRRKESIGKALKRLLGAGFVTEVEGVWIINPVDNALMDERADKLGTLGRNKKRIETHKEERRLHSYKIAVKKREVRYPKIHP